HRADVEDLKQRPQVFDCRGFVKSNANSFRVDDAQIDAVRFGDFHEVGAVSRVQIYNKRVKVGQASRLPIRVTARRRRQAGRLSHFIAEPYKPRGENRGKPMDAARDVLQTLWSVIDRVSGSHVCQEGLRGADVAGGFFPANVLFPRAEREPQGGAANRVLRDTDKPAGHLTFKGLARGEVSGVRSPVAQ